jgi:hypothetical protein
MSNRKAKFPKFTEKKLETLDNLILLEELTHYINSTSTKIQKRPYYTQNTSNNGTKYFFNMPNSEKEIGFVITHDNNKRVNYDATSVYLESFLDEWPGFFDSLGKGSLLEDLKDYYNWVVNDGETVWTQEEIKDMDYILQILRTRI